VLRRQPVNRHGLAIHPFRGGTDPRPASRAVPAMTEA
jgi:hypothetical protein